MLKGEFKNWEKKGELNSPAPLPDSFPLKREGVVDAVAMWFIIFKRECFERFGLFDERFYPGGAEDYDYNARVYREKGRLVGTTKSWVWHHWGMSKDTLNLIEKANERGISITFDQYPYNRGSSDLKTALPPWVREGTNDDILERIKKFEIRIDNVILMSWIPNEKKTN